MNDQPKYLCWAEHAEDLTEMVKRERDEPGELTLRYLRPRDAEEAAPKKIIVECSQGHMNTFEL